MATPTAAAFLASYPEFAQAPEALVTAKLAESARRTDAAVWGALYSDGVMTRAADLLAKSPFGRSMKLVMDSGRTGYSDDLERMERQVASGYRVT